MNFIFKMRDDLVVTDLVLIEISTLSADEKKLLVEKWLTENEIQFKQTSPKQYKILNGVIPNIMLYPTTSKVMFQEKGKNYVIGSMAENLIKLIKGDLDYKSKSLECK